MKTGLIPADEALQIIMQDATPAQAEPVDLWHADGRVLAEDVKALRTQPPFNASAMDGYAVKQEALQNVPVTLNVIGQSAAGHPFKGEAGTYDAVRIFTGAPVPASTDTIIIQENTRKDGNKVEILSASAAGRFIRPIGLDFSEGEVLLERGRMLDPQSVSLCASMNHTKLRVWKKPKVAILATGDELVLPGNPLKSGEIIASNSYGLGAIIKKSGGDVLDLGIAGDTVKSLTDHVNRAIEEKADMIITIGGASVGDHDLVKPAMEELGFSFKFAKIAMRPGKPFLFATNTIANHPIRMLGLAGNPVSSLVAGQVFVSPLVKALAGLPASVIRPVRAKLGSDLPENDERQEFMRVQLHEDSNADRIVTPFETQDSSMLANLNRADALLIRPANAAPAMAGDPCDIILLR